MRIKKLPDETRAEFLLRARGEIGLRPGEMAAAMGVSYDTYKNWENGHRGMAAASVRLAEVLTMLPKTAAFRLAAGK